MFWFHKSHISIYELAVEISERGTNNIPLSIPQILRVFSYIKNFDSDSKKAFIKYLKRDR